MSLWNRYQKVIAQGCLTNSKHPRSHIDGVYPKVFDRLHGNNLIGEYGEKYIDYICGLGANITGEIFLCIPGNPSFNTVLEIEAAEMVRNFFPFIDKLKFLKTGTEACMAAIKIARAYTGRDRIISEGYHGWSDDFVSLSDPCTGVPTPRPWIEKFTDFSQLKDAAAIIVEPVITDWSRERREWLAELRKHCTTHGTLLIFDEIITGLRFKDYSVAKNFGIYPDIICLGKALGGGYPLAVVGGRADIMDNPDYFVSSTFAGDNAALRGWLETAKFLKKNKIDDLWEDGRYFMERFNSLPIDVKIVGYPTRGAFQGDIMQRALLFQEACYACILFGPSWFFNFKHAAETDHTIGCLIDIAARILRGEVKLNGEIPKSPFSERVRKDA